MRSIRPVAVVYLCFALVLSAYAQAPQRDAQAIAILTQCLNAAGGSALVSAVQDFTATGTITYNWAGQQVTGPVAVYGKGLTEFRIDASVSGGTQSFIVNGRAGNSVPVNGPAISVPFFNVMTTGSLTFPASRIVTALNDPSTSISFVGPVAWNGSQVYQVHVAPPVDPTLTLNGALSGLGQFDLFIDPTSSQLLELSENVWSNTDTGQSYLHEIIFSTYTATNGLSIPFGITEKIAGQQTWSMTLTSVTFNNGLSDSLFIF
jgi:hypothetical protein